MARFFIYFDEQYLHRYYKLKGHNYTIFDIKIRRRDSFYFDYVKRSQMFRCGFYFIYLCNS